MLPKYVNSSRRSRVSQNSSIGSIQKRKNCSAQTNSDSSAQTNLELEEHGACSISVDGKISEEDQNNYKKALKFVNEWNKAMNDYLKNKSINRKQDSQDFFDVGENFNLASVPNYMALFLVLQEVDNVHPDTKKAQQKHSYTQTQNSEHKVTSVDVKSQTHYVRFCEQTMDKANIENIPTQIPETQYGTYAHKRLQKTQSIIKNSNHYPLPLKNSTRFSDSSIEKSRPDHAHTELLGSCHRVRSANVGDNPKISKLKQNQSFASVSRTKFRRTTPALLSPNGMIAAEINANGTPQVVRDMFEQVQNAPGVFVSQGNILKNISSCDSSGSSVILSDKESVDIEKDERDDVERTSSPYGESFEPHRVSSGCGGEFQPIKHHPLSLNERDMNGRDRNFISSIGIFTDAGQLKPDAKSYLEAKEDVRKGTFRAPRLSQLHMTKNYNVKAYTSESLFSDVVSTKSSEFDE